MLKTINLRSSPRSTHEPLPFSDTQKGRDFRVQLFHRHSAAQAADTFAPLPPSWGVTMTGKGEHTARLPISLAPSSWSSPRSSKLRVPVQRGAGDGTQPLQLLQLAHRGSGPRRLDGGRPPRSRLS